MSTNEQRSIHRGLNDQSMKETGVRELMMIKIEVIENDFSRNATFGFRFESYVPGNLFYDTTDNQFMSANITAVIGDNSFPSNGEYQLNSSRSMKTCSLVSV